MIHLPGLRGNPERTSSVTAADVAYRGTFDRYVASLIARWGSEEPARVRQVSEDLNLLGLTWKIEAKGIDETQVELRVGRLPRPKRGRARDLVNIADVGLGVSQTLPVVVALHAARSGQLVYIEQPEIHLHPRAQVAMARLLVNAANRGVRVVAETHSLLILLAVQTLVAEGVIDPSLVGLNWFLREQRRTGPRGSRRPSWTRLAGSATGRKTSMRWRSKPRTAICPPPRPGWQRGDPRGQGPIPGAGHRRLDRQGGRGGVDASDLPRLPRVPGGRAAGMATAWRWASPSRRNGTSTSPVSHADGGTSMVARKRIEFIEVAPHLTLEKRVTRAVADAFLTAIIDKDRRLIEAALVTEKRVTSLDDHVRRHLQDQISQWPEVRSICWVNPCTPEEKAIAWLESGAPAERTRLLGHVLPRFGE